jgi:hypothetical protein
MFQHLHLCRNWLSKLLPGQYVLPAPWGLEVLVLVQKSAHMMELVNGLPSIFNESFPRSTNVGNNLL